MGNREAIPVEFPERSQATMERRVLSIHAGVQVPDAHAGASEALLPAFLDVQALQPPG
jgi:hypothetical protein